MHDEYFEYIYRPLNDVRKQKFLTCLAPITGPSVLDIGCGESALYWAMGYVTRVQRVTLIDQSKEIIQSINEQLNELDPERFASLFADTISFLKEINLLPPALSAHELCVQLTSKIKTVQTGSFLELEDISGTFDQVISLEALECVDTSIEAEQALKHIFRVLRSGGSLHGSILRYANQNPLIHSLIERRLEGRLNPTEEQWNLLLKNAGFSGLQSSVLSVSSEEHPESIFYCATRL